MTYAAALARLRKITDPSGEDPPKLTKGASVSFVSPPGGTDENLFVSETVPLERQAAPPAPEPQWPPECLAAERKFRVPSAKLYPLLNHLVLTPEGAGILLQVFDDRVQVHFESEAPTREFRPEQIAVPDDVRQTKGAVKE